MCSNTCPQPPLNPSEPTHSGPGFHGSYRVSLVFSIYGYGSSRNLRTVRLTSIIPQDFVNLGSSSFIHSFIYSAIHSFIHKCLRRAHRVILNHSHTSESRGSSGILGAFPVITPLVSRIVGRRAHHLAFLSELFSTSHPTTQKTQPSGRGKMQHTPHSAPPEVASQ